ncbi:MAG: type II toxin-antitoxin system VapC family toxin [Candidatus Methanodesulfokora sp.]|jgi:predicted nucleic acid-binding protein|nr:MAG: hypothetical protein C0200_05905 [Candidatus Korarchaeota archaeon]
MRVVIDSSAAAKWYLTEDESEEMKLLRGEILAGRVEAHVPSLFFVELANLLRYARGLSSDDVINGVRAAMSIGLVVHNFDEVLDKAVEIAFRNNLTIYDSVYAALAEILDATLLTYDEKLLENIKKSARAKDLLKQI